VIGQRHASAALWKNMTFFNFQRVDSCNRFLFL
jgi:hypothetical protein